MKKFPFLVLILLFNPIFVCLFPINYNPLTRSNSNDISVEGLENEDSDLIKTSQSSKDWTFMVYIDADCNLESLGIDDINEMEMVGSDSNINVIVQVDRINGFDDSNDDWTGTKRYYIIRDYDSETISSTNVGNLGESNMGSIATLQNFIQWGKSNYPADHYALILWDHGSGVMAGSAIGGVCWDNSNYDDYLTISEISSILSNPTYSVDLLGFDACLMGAIEVHYQLKDSVEVIIGSEELEPGEGYPYNTILNYLKSTPTATPQQLGEQIVIKYDDFYPTNEDITQAAANALTVEFTTSLSNFISDLNAILGSQKTNIENAREDSQEFDEISYIDLYDFAQEVQSECSGPIDTSSQYLMNNISNIIIEETHSLNPGAHGLSIYFPKVLSSYSPNYELLEFASDLQWDEFLEYYLTGETSGYDDDYEENDDFPEAKIILSGSYNLICNASDYDFFNLSVQAGNIVEIDLIFEHDEGDLDLYLGDPEQDLIEWSESVTDHEEIIYTATESGYHTILVAQYEPYQEYQSYLLEVIIDDLFEDNDDPYYSTLIDNNTLYSDLVCRDNDFYYFWATENYLINITIEFNYADGDLDLYLYDDYGYFLSASYTATDNENILYSANYSGWHIIWVYNYSNNFNYQLRADVLDLDDNYETNHGKSSNNFIDYANPIPYGDYTSLVCINNDFYNISLSAGAWINITLYFEDEEGDLDVYLVYVNSWVPYEYEIVGFSTSSTDNEVIYYEVETSGYYYILISPYEINLNYSLCIHLATGLWDDDFENNDWFNDAALLDNYTLYDNLTAIDWDTYYIYSESGFQVTFTLDYNVSHGDLDLYLIEYDDVDDIGWILSYSISSTDQDQIIFDIYNAGYYFLLVYPYEINMYYNLTLSRAIIPDSDGDDGNGGNGDEVIIISGIPLIALTAIIGVVVIYLIKKTYHLK